MSLRVAIEHSEAKDLLQAAEKRDGKIGVYRIELADGLPSQGFAPLPLGPVSAHLVYEKDSPRYMYTNMMDDYCRCTLVEPSDLKAEPVFLRSETPNADLEAKRHAKEQLQNEAAERVRINADIAEKKHLKNLGLVNDFAMLLGMDSVPKNPAERIVVSALHAKMTDLAVAQGGTLTLGAIPKPELKSSKFNQAVLNEFINHGKYIALGKHDVSMTIEKTGFQPSSAVIQFKDLDGRSLATATVGFNSEVHRYTHSSPDYLDMDEDHGPDDTYTTYSLDLKGESGVKPVFIENGRPVLLKNSHFKTLYRELQGVDMALYPDHHMHRGVRKVSFGDATPVAVGKLMAKPELVKEVGKSRALDRGRSQSVEQGLSA